MDPYTTFFLHIFEYLLPITYLITGVASPILFPLDGKRADVVMLSSLSVSSALFLYAFFTYLALGTPSIHIPLVKMGRVELFGLMVDPISMLTCFVVWTAGLAFMIYSVEYISPRNREHPVEKGKGRFYGWMMLFIAVTAAFILSSTLLQLLMFFELMSLACWGVVSYYREPESYRAAVKAFVTTHVGALSGLFIALALCFLNTGNLSLYALHSLRPGTKLAIFVTLLAAAVTKSAQFPTYSWLPDAMVAPTPASAFLHGAAMVEMGVYLLARGIQFLSPLPSGSAYLLLAIVCITLLITAFMYIPQTDAKRLLAYSTIAESATMYAALVPACLGISAGVYIAIFILALHAYIKGLAFLTTGIFSYYIGDKTIQRVKGLLRANGFVAMCWIVSLLGLAGVPPMPLFFGKLILFSLLSRATCLSPIMTALIVVLAIDVISFGIVALRWIHETVLSPPSKESSVYSFTLHPAFEISMVMLLAMLLLIPYISYASMPAIHAWW